MGDVAICFARADRVVGQFLTELGFGPTVVDRGRITPDDMHSAGVNVGSLYQLAVSASGDAGRQRDNEEFAAFELASGLSRFAFDPPPQRMSGRSHCT